jgi:beta-lactamase class A
MPDSSRRSRPSSCAPSSRRSVRRRRSRSPPRWARTRSSRASAAPAAKSFEELAAALETLAPRTGFLAAELTGGACAPIHALRGDETFAIGSTFKLYVLLALADAILADQFTWDTPLEIRADWKSLPTGRMQDEPAGAVFPIRAFAEQMIAISDNTATDHLLYRLGRLQAEAAMVSSGHAAPQRNQPFLTTRELFWFKLAPGRADLPGYLALDTAGRRIFLAEQVAGKLPDPASAHDWKLPREIDALEWFASPADLCRVAGALRDRAQKPAAAPLLAILSANPGVQLDPARWPYAGFKGGSEPGVLNLTWLLRRADDRWFAATFSFNDPAAALDEAAIFRAVTAVFELIAARP